MNCSDRRIQFASQSCVYPENFLRRAKMKRKFFNPSARGASTDMFSIKSVLERGVVQLAACIANRRNIAPLLQSNLFSNAKPTPPNSASDTFKNILNTTSCRFTASTAPWKLFLTQIVICESAGVLAIHCGALLINI